MSYCITIIILLALSFTTYAQSDARISIGERGTKHAIAQPISEKISASIMRENGKLYVSAEGAGDNKYIVAQYEISVLPKGGGGDIIGPFLVKDDNAQKVFDQLHTWFETGAKVFYEKIMLICRECTPPEPINARGIAVTLE